MPNQRQKFKVGDWVRILDGPHTGMEGQVVMLNSAQACVDSQNERKGFAVVNHNQLHKTG